MKGFFSELVRRKVVRSVGAYLVLLWLLAQGFAALYPAFGLPPWSLTAFVITGLCLTPLFAWLAWRYDIVPLSVRRDAKDLAAANPGHRFAASRHDGTDAGLLIVRWGRDEDRLQEGRFQRPVAIGREPGNDIELADERVSRCHAVIWAERKGWFVRDMGSANGTFLDGERVEAAVPLPPRCELQLHPEGPKLRISQFRVGATLMDLPPGGTT